MTTKPVFGSKPSESALLDKYLAFVLDAYKAGDKKRCVAVEHLRYLIEEIALRSSAPALAGFMNGIMADTDKDAS